MIDEGQAFKAVFIISIETMPLKQGKSYAVDEREVSRFYIAMKRAMEWLFLSCSSGFRFTHMVQQQRTERQTDEIVSMV